MSLKTSSAFYTLQNMSIHSLLNKVKWDVDEMRSFLENDSTSINYFDSEGFAPLHRLLKDPKCEVDIVKLFLHHGANPNLETFNRNASYPLILSFMHKRNTEVMRCLIYAGAHVNVCNEKGHSPLCICLLNNLDPELIQILLDAGCSPNICLVSNHSLYCLKPHSALSLDVCKLLIEKDPSIVTEVDNQMRSLLCHALTWNTEPDTIKYLLEAGCSMTACQRHISALVCASIDDGPLKKGTVQLLLDAGDAINKPHLWPLSLPLIHRYHIWPLSLALEYRTYEEDAIKLLYKYEVEHYDNVDPYLLFRAVRNANCKPSIVQFLIDEGVDFLSWGGYGETPLHFAVLNENCQTEVIQILLDNNGPVNNVYYKINDTHNTALNMALSKHKSLELIEMLLRGGARLAAAGNISTILQTAFDKYNEDQSQENMNFFKVLMKYAYLENPKFKLKDAIKGCRQCHIFSNFENECVREIQMLRSNNIFQFVGRYSDYKPKAKGDQLLKVPSINLFNVYFDVIWCTFGKKAVDTRVQVQPIYCICYDAGFPQKLILIDEAASKIASLLSDKDKFTLLVALYETEPSPSTSHAKKNNLKRKRSSKK